MHQISKLKCFLSHLAVVFAQSIEARCLVENEDVVGAAPTGNAPTTSELSTILLPNKVLLILEIWWFIGFTPYVCLSIRLSVPHGCQLCGSLHVSWIIFICGTNTTHEGMMCHIPFPGRTIGQKSRSHGSFKFLLSDRGHPSRSPIYNFLLVNEWFYF